MKNLFLITLLTMIPVGAFAKDYECKAEKDKITKDLMKEVQCTHDQECGYFNYGYPWQPDVCSKAIVNVKKENRTLFNLRLIAEYNNNCIYPDDEEKKKFEDFKEQMTVVRCSEPVRVYCYKGFCRTQSYAIYNDK